MRFTLCLLGFLLIAGCDTPTATPPAGAGSGSSGEGLPDTDKRKPGEDVPPL